PNLKRDTGVAPYATLKPPTPTSQEPTICETGPGWSGEVLTYRRTGAPPPANQHGPHWYPIHNVFGDWQVVNDTDPDFDQPPSLAVRQCAAAHIPEQTNAPNSPGWSWSPNPGA
ncbi:hypothetical protein ACLQ3C_21515, partial [Gordonia sp. DT30]